jgi:hypothetical protein
MPCLFPKLYKVELQGLFLILVIILELKLIVLNHLQRQEISFSIKEGIGDKQVKYSKPD